MSGDTPSREHGPELPTAGAGGALTGRFRRLYGESPLHLLILLASFALCAYAALKWMTYDWVSIAEWFIGAAVIHDVVLVPLYAVTDWVLHRLLGSGGGTGGRSGRTTGRAAVNFIRVPAFASLVLVLVYWPLVLNDSPHYEPATTLSASVFLGRWLLITAVLFAASATWFVAGRWRAHRGGASG